MDASVDGEALTAIEPCADGWTELYARIAESFARSEARERAGRHLAGLLERVERRNGWQLAVALGESGPQGVQRLPNAAVWDADGARDDLRAYVVEQLGDEATGVLIVDETGFLKKGTKSCGAAGHGHGRRHRQLPSGGLPGVLIGRGAAFIDRDLYLPREWTVDQDRRTDARVPEETGFVTKIDLARRMLARAFDGGVPARWVVADAFYGRSHALRRWLEEREKKGAPAPT